MLAHFNESGKIPEENDILISFARGVESRFLHLTSKFTGSELRSDFLRFIFKIKTEFSSGETGVKKKRMGQTIG